MKRNIFKSALLLVLAFTFASFTTLLTRDVNVTESSIQWKGYKVTGSHEGTIALENGTLMFEDDKLVGGNFTIDMTSIVVTDLSAGKGKENLEGHLKSDDFFGVEEYPKAMFKMTSVSGGNGTYQVKGDMTIKGKTNPVAFDMVVSGNTATANFKIDRTKYGIKYKSGSFFDNLKDKAIYDEFDLNVMLKF